MVQRRDKLPEPSPENGEPPEPSLDRGSDPRRSPEEAWFTVPRAAELLGVSVTKVYDGIRDGKMRVRFQAEAPGSAERPMVTSDELRRNAATVRTALPMESRGTAPAAPPPRNGDETREHQQALEAERTIRRELERALAAEAARRKEFEDSLHQAAEARSRAETLLEKEQREHAAAEDRFQSLRFSFEDVQKRATTAEQELERVRASVEQAEDKIESSLRAVYERDVRIARLEAEVGAAERTRQHGTEFTERLQERITRLEDRSEEKEREIRRLALGLGEARGEIRLLRAPEEDMQPSRLRWLRRNLPWLAAAAFSALLAWVAHSLAESSRSLQVAALVPASVLAAFAAGAFLRRRP